MLKRKPYDLTMSLKVHKTIKNECARLNIDHAATCRMALVREINRVRKMKKAGVKLTGPRAFHVERNQYER